MTISRRIALVAASAVALAIVVASVTVYVSTRSELRSRMDDDLRALIQRVEVLGDPPAGVKVTRKLPDITQTQGRSEAGGSTSESARTDAGPEAADALVVPGDPLGGATGVAQLVLPNGSIVSSSAGRATDVPIATAGAGEVARGVRSPYFADLEVDDRRVRAFVTRGPGGRSLVVARPLAEIDASLSRLRWILVFVSLGGIAVAAGLGLLVSRAALRPVTSLTDTAEHVARTQDLSQRLPEGGVDELARLGASFNTMLGALESARQAQRELVADASHELRTPLTSVRTNIELLARAPDLPAEEREAIVASATAQLEELTVLIDDLVDLARPVGAPDIDEPVDDVRLDLLVADAVERAQRHAPGARFEVDAPDEIVLPVMRGRVVRAVGNLLDNALKHGPGDGVIEVAVRAIGPSGGADGSPPPGAGDRSGSPGGEEGARPRGATITVRDHGPGIAVDDLPRVFDRFYRADDARGLPGSGLGLAIVRQVAEQHGGHVHAERVADEDGGGTRLTLTLAASAGGRGGES